MGSGGRLAGSALNMSGLTRQNLTYLHHIARLVPTVAVIVLMLASVACGENLASRTPTPTPTPTLTPAPTSTPIPVPAPRTGDGAPDVTLPLGVAEGPVVDLLAAVPIEYENVAFLDLKQILGSEALSSSLNRLGVLAALGPAAGQVRDRVDSILIAQGAGGVLGVLRGEADPRSVAEAIKSPDSELKIESHGEFEVLSVQVQVSFFSLVVALARVDETTALFAVGSSLEGASELVRASLDTATGAAPGLSADPSVGRLLFEVPPGFAVTLDPRCDLLPGLESCTGAAVSATLDGELGSVHGVFIFSSPKAAQAALPVIGERAGQIGGSSAPSDVQAAVDGSAVHIEGAVDLEAALEWAMGQMGA